MAFLGEVLARVAALALGVDAPEQWGTPVLAIRMALGGGVLGAAFPKTTIAVHDEVRKRLTRRPKPGV